MLSVVIPAHNEVAVLGRLLSALLAGADADEFDIVVVPNGCTDATVTVAAGFGPPVRVVESPVPGKAAALRLGDEYARGFPRLYVDADVVLGAADARLLAEVLRRGDVLAAAPRRVIDLAGCSRVVRWYYDIWQRLPTVREGIYGRGVIGVSESGYRRLAAMPQAMADDLAASVAFTAAERAVLDGARVVIKAPRGTADLVRRRVRSVTGIAQLHGHAPQAVDAARTTKADLFGIARRDPRTLPRLLVFLAVTLVARRRARAAVRSGDFSTWLRDESSREHSSPAGEG